MVTGPAARRREMALMVAAKPTPAELEAALAAAYEADFEFVWRSLRRLGVPPEQLEDAAQDVFVVAARRVHEFEGRAKVRTWLFAIAQRVAQRKRRDAFRHRRRTEALATEQAHTGGDRTRDPSAAIDAASTLAAMLDHLDDAQRLVFVLVEVEQLSAVEVGEALDTNVNTIYSRLRTARTKLRQLAEQIRERDDAGPSTPPREKA